MHRLRARVPRRARILRLTLGSTARPSLTLPARIYAGYPVIAAVSGDGLPNGSPS